MTVYVFDAYGTLLDLTSAVSAHRDRLGERADRLVELWRIKQLEYTWVRSLMGAYVDFQAATAAGLDYAVARVGGIPPSLRDELLTAYASLAAYPEVPSVLRTLKDRDAVTAILSNGTMAMLEKAIAAAGLDGLLDAIISVDELRTFKTDPRTYQLATERLGAAPAAISFQSSNRWDIAGATKAGFETVWINRAGLPDEYPDLPPARVLESLEGLLGRG